MSKDSREKMVIMSAKLRITVEEWRMLKIEIVGQEITVQYLKLKAYWNREKIKFHVQNPSDLWDDIKQVDIHIIEVPEGERENRQGKKCLKT